MKKMTNKKESILHKLKGFLNQEFLRNNFNYDDLIYVLKLENDQWWIGKT